MLEFFGTGGEHISSSQLPLRGRKRWTIKDKLLVVAAVQYGVLTFADACARYSLSLEEFLIWQRSFDEIWRSGQTESGRYRH
jgi:hypothetical protein